jgi:hypothetical protein
VSRKLTIDDIADLREYERERPQYRQRVVALKARRRVALGPIITVLFENRETVRYQIQEMARVEKIVTDEGIQTELDIYNSLVPEPGQLMLTMFIELTNDGALREWLPKLVGIERSLLLRFHDGTEVSATVEQRHASQLTRDETTASVHYVQFDLTPEQVALFRSGPVTLRVDHPNYQADALLSDATVGELVGDLAA